MLENLANFVQNTELSKPVRNHEHLLEIVNKMLRISHKRLNPQQFIRKFLTKYLELISTCFLKDRFYDH